MARFCRFIRGFSPADSLPYLGDVAMLEFAQRQALHARRRAVLPPAEYPSDAEELLGARVEFHPSWRLVRSQYPLFDIWQAHQAHQHDGDHSIGDKAQSITLIRQQIRWCITPLDADGLAFFEALASGCSFAETAERIAAQNADEVQKWIQLALASATALTLIRRPKMNFIFSIYRLFERTAEFIFLPLLPLLARLAFAGGLLMFF